MSQNIQRVDHVIYAVLPENQEAYVQRFSDLCRVKFFGPNERPNGLRTYMSWRAGINIIAPVSDTLPLSVDLRSYIDRRGEGIVGMTFGVADIHEARQHALSLGYEISDMIENDGAETFLSELETMLETRVWGDINNSIFVFGQIKLTPETSSSNELLD